MAWIIYEGEPVDLEALSDESLESIYREIGEALHEGTFYVPAERQIYEMYLETAWEVMTDRDLPTPYN